MYMSYVTCLYAQQLVSTLEVRFGFPSVVFERGGGIVFFDFTLFVKTLLSILSFSTFDVSKKTSFHLVGTGQIVRIP